MITLRTLGTVGLTADSGADLAPVLRQPKRFALLLYLALARPGGFQRRDSLLALFWPDLDDEHARASLRQALYTLRRQLPEGVLANRGDAEIGLAPGTLWADAHEFEERLAAADPEGALELYRGPLLPGFHVSDASAELDQWLEAERARLHEMAVSAAGDACAAAEARGDLDGALRWAARAAELAPLDEGAARREIELRFRAGDRAGALLAFDGWATRLRAELELTPDPATLELVERVRTEPVPGRRAGRQRPPAEAPPTTATTGSRPVSNADADSGDARRTRRRIGHLTVGVATGLALAALIALLPVRLDWSDGSAAPAGSRVMVLPFSYRGGGEAGYLTEGLVYLFSVALDGEELRALEPNALIRRAGEDGVRVHDVESAAGLAERLGASYFLLGSVVETGGGLQLTASLHARDEPLPVARATATGAADDVLGLVDEVAAELLTTLAGGSSSRIVRLAAVTSHSLSALKAYLTGERLMRQGRYEQAIEAFEAAVGEDSLFALAHYRTSQAASWAFQGDRANRAAAAAARLADRLPDRERRLLLGHEAYRRGRAAEALGMLRELSLVYPDDPEVWYRLGEVQMHFGPLNGWAIGDAAVPFARTVELDSSYTDALYHLAQLDALAGDTARALQHVDVHLRLAPAGSRAPQLRVLRASLDRSMDWQSRLRDLKRADDFTVVSSVYNAGVYAGRLDRARDIARLLVAPGRPEPTRIFGHLILAELELAGGRARAARGQLGKLEELDPAAADQYGALLAAAPAVRPRTDELAALAERLSAPPASPPGGDWLWRPEERYAPLPRLYSLGTAVALLGDSDRVERLTAELAADSALPPDYLTELALLAAERGTADFPEAAPPRFAWPAEEAILSLFLSRPARRFQEARRLEREGRLGEALVWYESLDVFSVHDLPWGVPALLDRARVHERRGEDAQAAALYQRFADLWREADDQAPRREALERLAFLRGGRDR